MRKWKLQHETNARSEAYAWKDAIVLSVAFAEETEEFLVLMALSGNAFDSMTEDRMQITLNIVELYDEEQMNLIPMDRVNLLKKMMEESI